MIKILAPPVTYSTRSIVNLDGRSYRLRLRYDERNASWYLDAVTAPQGAPIVHGWRLTDGTAVDTYGEGWAGVLTAFPVGRGAWLHNPEDLLEGRSVVAYYPEAGIPTAGDRRYSVRKTAGS